jgi:hypothetical protein
VRVGVRVADEKRSARLPEQGKDVLTGREDKMIYSIWR